MDIQEIYQLEKENQTLKQNQDEVIKYIDKLINDFDDANEMQEVEHG